VNYPTPYGIASDGYKALVCKNIDGQNEFWSIAFLFRIGKEKKNPSHTVVSIDYVLIDPSSRITFSRLSTCIRLMSQYVLKKNAAMDKRRKNKTKTIDLMISMDSQLNPIIAKHIENALINEGLRRNSSGKALIKRIKSVDENTGKDSIAMPLPNVGKANVKGMRPLVQSTIQPIPIKTGGTVRFIGRIEHGSKQYLALIAFCRKYSNWLEPPITERLTYMQSLFTGEQGDVVKYVDSLIEDAHFVVSVDDSGHIRSFMAFVVGYSVPALFTGTNDYSSPERTIFVPTLVCEAKSRGVWTKNGFQQALNMYKMLFSVLGMRENKRRFNTMGAMVSSSSLHAHLLDAIGFAKRASFSNAPAHHYTSDFYAKDI
jgi:hypothetical protein